MAQYGEITIVGLYEADNTIFDWFELASFVDDSGEEPVTVTISKDILVHNILDELDEFEILVPDPDKIKNQIKWWSKKLKPNWDILFKTLNEEYNPLHNYDRNETHSENETGNQQVASNDASVGGNLTKVSAYNSSTLADRDKVETSINSNASSTSSNSVLRSYTRRMYGNIGVTTSQELLEAEMKLRQSYNIYDLIIMDFKDRFCLLVY